MAAAQPNNRASLLAGLRTGGVRSVSIPHTASPGGAFNVPRIASASVTSPHHYFPEEQEINHLSEMMGHTSFIHDHQPRTAALDNHGSRLSQQQQELLMQRQLAAQRGAMSMTNGAAVDMHAQAQLQLQMMQMEIMRLHAMAQMQQFSQMQADPYGRRGSDYGVNAFQAPAPVAPAPMAGGSPLAQLRARQLEQSNAYSAVDPYSGAPMTAALGGKFGGRSPADPGTSPLTRGAATTATQSSTPSKSDSAMNWRRGTSPGAPINRGTSTSPVKDSPSSSDGGSDRSSPPPLVKSRPEPLHLARDVSPGRKVPVPATDDSETGDDSSSSKSDTEQNSSSPTTPLSSHSSSSAREEASKKLFQGLGMGRPSIHVTAPSEGQIVIPPRVTSQPIRQPRGPPAAVDELGDKNFANRIRKKAIGGLGALLEAREKREGCIESDA